MEEDADDDDGGVTVRPVVSVVVGRVGCREAGYFSRTVDPGKWGIGELGK